MPDYSLELWSWCNPCCKLNRYAQLNSLCLGLQFIHKGALATGPVWRWFQIPRKELYSEWQNISSCKLSKPSFPLFIHGSDATRSTAIFWCLSSWRHNFKKDFTPFLLSSRWDDEKDVGDRNARRILKGKEGSVHVMYSCLFDFRKKKR